MKYKIIILEYTNFPIISALMLKYIQPMLWAWECGLQSTNILQFPEFLEIQFLQLNKASLLFAVNKSTSKIYHFYSDEN